MRISHKLLGVTVVLSACQSLFASGISIGVLPSSQTAVLGSAFSLGLKIVGLGHPPSLGAFDLNLGFNPAILSLNSVTFGDPILGDQLDPTGGGNTINLFTPGVGTVELFDLSLDSASDLNSLQAPSFILASITFNTIGVGSSPLALSVNALGDENGNSLSANLQSGSIQVNTAGTPEPGTVLLFASGLVILAARSRRCVRRDIIRTQPSPLQPI